MQIVPYLLTSLWEKCPIQLRSAAAAGLARWTLGECLSLSSCRQLLTEPCNNSAANDALGFACHKGGWWLIAPLLVHLSSCLESLLLFSRTLSDAVWDCTRLGYMALFIYDAWACSCKMVSSLFSRPSVVTLACYMFYLDFSIDILNDKMIQLE